MKRAFTVVMLLLAACGSASDEKVGTTASDVRAKGGVRSIAPPGKVFVWRGPETAPHDLDADGAACEEAADGRLMAWADCMHKKGWKLEKR